MPLEGWKVLTVVHRGSAIINSASPAYRVYPRGQVVVPNDGCGPLAVFTNRGDAELFQEMYSYERLLAIHRCHYEPWDGPQELWMPAPFRVHTYAHGRVPLGITLAASVTCID